jgi:hypothetical protein
VLSLLGEGEGNMTNRWNAINGGASDGLTLRSHRPCACGDVVYAQLGRSSGSVGHHVLHIKGTSWDGAFDDKSLEVRQLHSSEEAREQIGLITKAEFVERRGVWSEGEGGAKGTDTEEAFLAED